MRKFLLRGLAEGLVGRSWVIASDLESVFFQFPVLAEIRNKLSVSNNTISGFSSCDG